MEIAQALSCIDWIALDECDCRCLIGLDPTSRPNDNINPYFDIEEVCIGGNCDFIRDPVSIDLDSGAPDISAEEPTSAPTPAPTPTPAPAPTPEPTPEAEPVL